jgi:hypothetical protein
MSTWVHTRTEDAAGERSLESAEPRHATAAPPPQLHSAARSHPNSLGSAARTTGAPQEGLLFARLCTRSQKHAMFVRKIRPNTRHSR